MLDKTVFYTKIKFIEPILGSQPASSSLYEVYIKSKLRKEIERIENILYRKKLSTEERIALEEKLKAFQNDENVETIIPDLEERLTVFPRDREGNLIIYNYQILGFYKEKANDFLKNGFKNKFSKYVDVRATLQKRYREILLLKEDKPIQKPDYILERPLRAFTPSGQYIVSIASSECIEPPVEAEFYTVVLGNEKLHGINGKVIETLLEIGQEKGGISQWRNAGFGKFKVIKFEKIR